MTKIKSIECDEPALSLVKSNDIASYYEQIPEINTKNGFRKYDLLCVAMRDEDDNSIVVRKDPNADSNESTDWLVVRGNRHQVKEEVVLSAKTYKHEDGDSIELEIVPDVSHHGPYTLIFSVDLMYGPDKSEVVLAHKRYYGRGVGVNGEMQIDAVYSHLLEHSEPMADVISINEARSRRETTLAIGEIAVAN